MWPSMRPAGDADHNSRGLGSCDVVANRRLQGNIRGVPRKMLAEERPRLGKLPGPGVLASYHREDRKVARHGFVSWEESTGGG